MNGHILFRRHCIPPHLHRFAWLNQIIPSLYRCKRAPYDFPNTWVGILISVSWRYYGLILFPKLFITIRWISGFARPHSWVSISQRWLQLHSKRMQAVCYLTLITSAHTHSLTLFTSFHALASFRSVPQQLFPAIKILAHGATTLIPMSSI